MLNDILSDKYELSIIRLDKKLNSKPVQAHQFELRAVPKGKEWEGAIALMRTTNGKYYGPKFVGFAQTICRAEKIESLEGIKKVLEECRTTHHLNLKKKYEYLDPSKKKNKTEEIGIPF